MIATICSRMTGPSLLLLLGLLLCALHETVAEEVAFYKSVSANDSIAARHSNCRIHFVPPLYARRGYFDWSNPLYFLGSDLTFPLQFFASITPCQRSLRQAISLSRPTSQKTRAHISSIIQGYA